MLGMSVDDSGWDFYNQSMTVPILRTKLYIPAPPLRVVARPHLVERMNEGLRNSAGLARKLTLVSAPAGFGKTTLVGEWVHTHRARVAWLSLDEGDNDPTRFLTYLIAALQTVAPNVGEDVLELLDAPPPLRIETILTLLLNQVAALPNEIVLVLDDYHVIETKASDTILIFLLEHLPPQLHLLIATREDPALPLARLRAHGQMMELRASDLRFAPEEADGFLNRAMKLQLAPSEVAALETRTEGWIAGLQLAALSLQGIANTRGTQETSNFIKSFTGSHHFVMDYLVEQVLQQQPQSIQTFLLRTSVLDRVCGPLAEAVLNAPKGSGQETLEYLQRANLLVVPLDDTREWYRYHHLFAEVLQARLMQQQPQEVAEIHRRAGVWFEEHHLRGDAIRHALLARDFERAADWMELERAVSLEKTFQSATWLGWVKALPENIVRARPRLAVGYAWELLFTGDMEGADARMQEAEQLLEPTAGVKHDMGLSAEETASLRGSVAIARAFRAQALGDVEGAVHHAQRALLFVPERDYYKRGHASAMVGLAALRNGDLESAYRYMFDALVGVVQGGNLNAVNSATYVLAEIRVAQGRLLDANRLYEEALRLVLSPQEPARQGTAEAYLSLAQLYLERGDLNAAGAYVQRSEVLGKERALPDWQHYLCLTRAQVCETEGDLDAALELFQEAERSYRRSPVPNARPIAARKARVWIRQGKLTEAREWATSQHVTVEDVPSYMREFEHLTLARLLIASYRRDGAEASIHEALNLLERLRQAAEARGGMGSVIEILMLEALAYAAQGNHSAALAALERALTAAEPEGYVRLFVSEGMLMAELLTRAKEGTSKKGRGGRRKEYIDKLLKAFGAGMDAQAVTPASQGLVEPLTQRELDILKLIALGLSNQEIGKRLFLALSTVKGYNRNIFGKLDVTSRTEAIVRARALGLI